MDIIGVKSLEEWKYTWFITKLKKYNIIFLPTPPLPNGGSGKFMHIEAGTDWSSLSDFYAIIHKPHHSLQMSCRGTEGSETSTSLGTLLTFAWTSGVNLKFIMRAGIKASLQNPALPR